jgi:uncharacterized protein (TIGR03435 family)
MSNAMKIITALAIVITSLPLSHAQTPAQKPVFEVASIKASVDNRPPSFQAQPGGRFLVSGPLKLMLALAYSLRDYQISGGPGWVATDRWDLQAKAPEDSIPAGLASPGPATPNHPLLLMLQSLLEERFQLKMHREMREEPVYELTVAKNGSKMKLSSDQSSPEILAAPTAADPLPRGRMTIRGTTLQGNAIAMTGLISILADITKRPITNKTGLTGLYDFKLEWSLDTALAVGPNGQPDAPPNAPGPSFTTALQEQLGLRLESSRRPVEVLVIDSVSKPTEN